MTQDIFEEKKLMREKIWKLLEDKNIARFPLPVKDRIPNFDGSEKAAELLRNLDEWKNAKIIVANPDFAQKEVREFALKDKKILIMASPGLKHDYLKIDSNVDEKIDEDFASTIRGAFKYGKKLGKLPKPDLIVTGCVAVDLYGWRLGKGRGYGDREIKNITKKFGKIPVITTVHDLQIVEKVPHNELDTRVDIISTPNKIYRINL